MSWDKTIEVVRPHVVKIATPDGWGTGFLTFYNHDHRYCGIATAAHVVDHADDWQQPIRIMHEQSETPRFLKEDDLIFLDRPNDLAIVFFFKGDLKLPELPIPLLPLDQPCSIGADVGWLGYPGLAQELLCFFAGAVSARAISGRSYLIDGVAINGVSGGPVFHCPSSDKVQIIGCVSAYHANRATGETLPGLLRAQDVSHFHAVARTIQDLNEANAKKREFEEAQNTRQAKQVDAPAGPVRGAPPKQKPNFPPPKRKGEFVI